MEKGEENKGYLQVGTNPLNSRGQFQMAATSEIWLDFLDIETKERRALNGDITTRVTPAGRRLYTEKHIRAIVSPPLYTIDQFRNQDRAPSQEEWESRRPLVGETF